MLVRAFGLLGWMGFGDGVGKEGDFFDNLSEFGVEFIDGALWAWCVNSCLTAQHSDFELRRDICLENQRPFKQGLVSVKRT